MKHIFIKKQKTPLQYGDLVLNKPENEQFIAAVGAHKQTTSGARIELANLGKKYEGNDEYTLKAINLVIEPGTFCIFLGPSGCGKTTLLRMIAGLNSVTRGDLLFNNKRFNNLSPSERDVAMVFQSYALYPHMNVYNNMSFGLKLAKERKDIIDRRVKDAAKILKIETHLYNKPKDLSGGQRQRVAIGRAIVRKPSVFLMDEPLSNLDAKLRESMRRELVGIHRMLGTTSVYVTHDQLEAMTMGDQIVVLNEGKIQQSGTSKQLYFQPQNLFVARFIGSPTINLFDGKVVGTKFVADHFPLEVPLQSSKTFKDVKHLVAGFRSEDIVISKTQKAGVVSGKIFNIEALGKEQSVIIKINQATEIVVTVANDLDFQLYQEVWLEMHAHKVHLFDRTTTQRLN